MARERIEKDFLIEIGNRLKEIRKRKGYSQEYVNEHTGINLHRVEKAQANFSLSTLYILCSFYKVSLEEFFKGL